MENYFKFLGLSLSATPEEIHTRYKELAKKYHPDKGGKTKDFQKLTEAVETLTIEEKRKEYLDKLVSLKKPLFTLTDDLSGRPVHYYFLNEEETGNGSMESPLSSTAEVEMQYFPDKINKIIY